MSDLKSQIVTSTFDVPAERIERRILLIRDHPTRRGGTASARRIPDKTARHLRVTPNLALLGAKTEIPLREAASKLVKPIQKKSLH